MSSAQLQFSLAELLSLVGLAQAVYTLVYIGFRAGDRRSAILPFLYFAVLAGAFLLDFGQRFLAQTWPDYDIVQWFAWFAGPPLSVLLILQIARSGRLPQKGEFKILLWLPTAFLAAYGIAYTNPSCHLPGDCDALREWLPVTGLVAGALSLGAIWLKRDVLRDIARQKSGEERYWVTLTLIIMNLVFLGITLLFSFFHDDAVLMVRTVTGIGLVYLAGTGLFRIYPQAVQTVPPRAQKILSAQEEALAVRIRELIDLQKVYHEPSYSRADLAREAGASESVVSRVLNHTYKCTFPQLLNERRVEDAKRLLLETDAAINVIAGEVGFNSLASFNRVFRDLTGLSPSDYKAAARHTA